MTNQVENIDVIVNNNKIEVSALYYSVDHHAPELTGSYAIDSSKSRPVKTTINIEIVISDYHLDDFLHGADVKLKIERADVRDLLVPDAFIQEVESQSTYGGGYSTTVSLIGDMSTARNYLPYVPIKAKDVESLSAEEITTMSGLYE